MASTIQQIETPKRARALDTSGNNNHGQIYSGRALEFDGVTDYLSVSADVATDFPSLTITGSSTISCWINLNSLKDAPVWIASHTDGNQRLGLTLGNEGEIAFVKYDGGASTYTNKSGGVGTVNINTWYRVVCVLSSGSQKIYINNYELTGDSAADPNNLASHTGNTFKIGFRNDIYFDGMISDFQVWDTAWSADDITYDYLNLESLALNRGGTSLTNSNLKLWYPMQDGHRGHQSYVLDASNTGLGSELITEGDFSSKGTNWTFFNSTTGVVQNKAIITSNGSNAGVRQAISRAVGDVVKVTFNISSEAGVGLAYVRMTDSSGNNPVDLQPSGSWDSGITTVYHTVVSSNPILKFMTYATVGDGFTLEDVSVKPVNDKNNATTVFYGDELITTTADRDMSGANNWADYNGGTESPTGGVLQITVDGGGTSQGAQLAVSNLGTIAAGRTYRIQADLDFISGSDTDLAIQFALGNAAVLMTASDGSPSDGTMTTTEQTFYADITTIDASGALRINCTAATNNSGSNNVFTVDDISVKEVGLASGWTDADQQLHIPQTALQSYNELLWCTASTGTNTIVQVADNSNLDVDALDFSISCWIYPITESDYLPILRKGGAGAEGYSLVVNPSNYISLNLDDGSSNNSYTNLTNAVVPSGKWSHVVVTCDRDSATGIKCYLNGELQTATANPTGENEDIGNSAAMIMLGWSTGDADSFSGTGTEFMLFKDSILSQAEVNELYNDGKALDGTTHSLFSTKCTAYYRNNGLSSWSNLATVADSGATSSAAADGTIDNGTETMLCPSGVDSSRCSQGFIMNRQRNTSSFNKPDDGDISYIEKLIAPVTGSNAISLSAWIKVERLSSTFNGYVAIGDNDANESVWIGVHSSGNYGGGLHGTNIDSGNSVVIGDWVHLTLTYAGGSGGALVLYRDGEADGTSTGTAAIPTDSTGYVRIGGIGETDESNNYPLQSGEVDGVLIYNDVLSAPEVLRNYNATKGSHTN